MSLLTLMITLLIAAQGHGASGACDLYASPNGSDAAAGSLTAPLRTVQRLSDSLSPGQVGCLRSGVYHGARRQGGYEQIEVSHRKITLRSAPGERARLVGRLWIAAGADNVTIENLYLDGSNPRAAPSPTVNARGTTFRHNEVTNNHTSICFLLGSPLWGRAEDTLIEANRIHDCGTLPRTNFDHGIYLSAASDTTIRGNWIYANADRGIQLYPDAQRTLITGNVIAGNGVGIILSGDESIAASDTVVIGNVIANSTDRHNVESFYPPGGPQGTGNLLAGNCIHGARGWYGEGDGDGIADPQIGFLAIGTVNAAPAFVDAASADYRLVPGSACGSVLLEVPGGLAPGLLGAQIAAPAGS